jgi:hypothetical protein
MVQDGSLSVYGTVKPLPGKVLSGVTDRDTVAIMRRKDSVQVPLFGTDAR